MIENMDANIARLLKRLDDLKIRENTIVVFLSDNGPNSPRYNARLRGRKGSFDDGGVRVPFVIHRPGHLPERQQIATHSAHIDLLPTLAGLCGISIDPKLLLDGVDLTPLLRGEEFVHADRFLYTFPFHRPEIVKPGEELPGAIRGPRWCAVKSWQAKWSLYDLGADPLQENDLSAQHPVVLKQLQTAYDRKFQEVTAGGIAANPIKIGYPDHDLVPLKAGNAFLAPVEGGGLAFSHMGFPLPGNYLAAWTDASAFAYWNLESKRAGRYRATLLYALQREGRGVTVTLEAGANQVEARIDREHRAPLEPIKFRLEPEAKKYQVRHWARTELGTINLPEGHIDLKLRATAGLIPDTLEVKGIELERVERETSDNPGSAP